MIERMADVPSGIVAVRAVGTITPEDYETVVVPLLDEAARDGRRLRWLCEVGPEFRGMTPAGDGAGPIDLWLPLRGGADVLPGSPEHAPATVRRRAEVLIEHGWNPATHSALDIGIELEDHARTGGWRHVGAWLDILDISQGDLVDARCPVVAAHRDPRPPQDVPAEDLVP